MMSPLLVLALQELFSALGLEGKKVLLLDVGYMPKESPELSGNLDDLRSNSPDMFKSLIGSKI